MRKTPFVLSLVIVIAGNLFAAGARDSITVEGKLSVVDAVPSIAANGKNWILPAGPFYRLAWENGVKVGDSIKAEGFAVRPQERRDPMRRMGGKESKPLPPDRASPRSVDTASDDAKGSSADKIGSVETALFMPTRVWVNGKEIDLSTVRTGTCFDAETSECGYGSVGRADRRARVHDRDRDRERR